MPGGRLPARRDWRHTIQTSNYPRGSYMKSLSRKLVCLFLLCAAASVPAIAVADEGDGGEWDFSCVAGICCVTTPAASICCDLENLSCRMIVF